MLVKTSSIDEDSNQIKLVDSCDFDDKGKIYAARGATNGRPYMAGAENHSP